MKCHEEDKNHVCLIDDHCGHIYFFLRKDQKFIEDFYDLPAGFRFIDLTAVTKYSEDGMLRYDYNPFPVVDEDRLPF